MGGGGYVVFLSYHSDLYLQVCLFLLTLAAQRAQEVPQVPTKHVLNIHFRFIFK